MPSLLHISRAQAGRGVCCIMEDILALTESFTSSLRDSEMCFFSRPEEGGPLLWDSKMLASLERI